MQEAQADALSVLQRARQVVRGSLQQAAVAVVVARPVEHG